MDEFLILLQAKLDEAKSKENVNDDIDKIQSQLDKLKIQAELDPKAAQKLADSIGKLINQKIVISNIGIDGKSATKAGQEYGKQFSQGVSQELKSNSLKLDTFKKSLENIGMGSKEIDAVANRISNLGVQIETLNQARSSGKKDILSVNIAGIDEYGQAIKLTQQYNIATGELVNAIDAVSTAQQNIGNNTNSIKKAENVFADYTAKIEQFKSTNSNILSGLLDPLSDFESKLSGLKNGTASIDDVINSYKNLNAEASKITSNLSAQFNKIDSAVRNITKGDEVIASLRADFKGLSNAPKEVNSELTKCEKLLLNVKNIESQEGRTVNWSAAYKEWEQSLDSLRAKISTLKKEQSNVASTSIGKVQSNLSSLKTKWEEQGVLVGEFKTKVEQLESSLSSIGSKGELNSLKTQIQDLKSEASTIAQVNKIQLSIGDKGDTTTQIKTLTDNFTKLGLSADEVKSKMNSVDTELTELKSLLNSGSSNSAITSQFDRLQLALNETQNDLKATRSEYSLLVSAQQRLSKANEIEAWNQKNSKATKEVISANEAYIASLRDLNSQMTKMQYNEIINGFKESEISMRGLNKLGASLKDQFSQAAQSFTQWLSVSSGVMALVYQLQKMPKEVIAVNSAMIELNKVSNASTSEIKKYFDEAAESAKRYGSSVSDLISATADWSRLGYSLPDSKKLAEVATLYKNVGDGIDIATANESLVSTLQGFKLEANDAMHIIDAFNEVGNNFAIGSDGIGEALKRSASSMYAAGNTLEETIGLVTAANAVVQDPDSIGTAYKTKFKKNCLYVQKCA